ncbi:MAG: mismatch repair protein MutS, partial [Candidatus Hydrogenedentes bacterium]|nr:mismatch repair protein MutS [Candidatus Hydrogenedentota bacterium]
MAVKWKKLGDVPESKMTPMLRQYVQAKAECPDSILFFRMGDFFEMFFEDAIEAAELLGLTLTSRDGSDSEDRVPMCGVPYRTVDTYVARAIKGGRTVTICDQMEDPKLAKGIVKRAVVRTITPGTVMEPDLLDATSNNYLGALWLEDGRAGIAFVDVSTGEFLAAQVEDDVQRAIEDELTRMAPSEVLVSNAMDKALIDRLERRFDGVRFAPRGDDTFDAAFARQLLLDQFGLSTLKGVDLENAREATAAAGAILSYVNETQRDAVPHLRLPRRYSPAGYVVLDGNTQRNLELIESLADKKKRGTLLGVLDRTQTSMGGRKLRHWILHPLIDVAEIRARLDSVEELAGAGELRLELKELFRGVADLERLLSRLTSKAGNARDVKALGRSIEEVPGIKAALGGIEAPMLSTLRDGMDELRDVAEWIARAVVDEPPLPITEGNILKSGYHEELD